MKTPEAMLRGLLFLDPKLVGLLQSIGGLLSGIGPGVVDVDLSWVEVDHETLLVEQFNEGPHSLWREQLGLQVGGLEFCPQSVRLIIRQFSVSFLLGDHDIPNRFVVERFDLRTVRKLNVGLLAVIGNYEFRGLVHGHGLLMFDGLGVLRLLIKQYHA